MTQPTCNTCRFWLRNNEPDGSYGKGHCRRYPPSFMLEGTLNDGWPDVHECSWCGEHQPKESDDSPSRNKITE